MSVSSTDWPLQEITMLLVLNHVFTTILTVLSMLDLSNIGIESNLFQWRNLIAITILDIPENLLDDT